MFSWLRTMSVSDADIRAEIWGLGVRHNGAPLEGAQIELNAGNVAPARAELLRACVRRLKAAA